MIYTGIGSRRLPPGVGREITRLALHLAVRKWTLRSGGADGADEAFEAGAHAKEIYLPWVGFNGNSSRLYNVADEAVEKSMEFHPNPGRCSDAVRVIMGRNLYQVLGLDLRTPSRFVVCWTPYPTEDAFDPAKRIGGTGQALRIARHYRIPIYNLRDPAALQKLGEDLPCLESSEPRPNKTL